jgi:hypothetical protein
VEHKPKPGWKPWKPPPEERDRWGLRGKTVWDWLRACANRKVGSEVDRLMPAEGLRVQGHCTPL